MIDLSSSNPEIHNRRSSRMRGYDYSLANAYFITIVTFQRLCSFGEIANGEIILSAYGSIALEQWTQMEKRFPQWNFSPYVIMPNHVHGIVIIVRGAGEESVLTLVQIPPLRPYQVPLVFPDH
jgi:REP-associated tyrosine transposase